MATYNGEGPMWGGLDNLLRNTKELIEAAIAQRDSNVGGFGGEYVIL